MHTEDRGVICFGQVGSLGVSQVGCLKDASNLEKAKFGRTLANILVARSGGKVLIFPTNDLYSNCHKACEHKFNFVNLIFGRHIVCKSLGRQPISNIFSA